MDVRGQEEKNCLTEAEIIYFTLVRKDVCSSFKGNTRYSIPKKRQKHFTQSLTEIINFTSYFNIELLCLKMRFNNLNFF